MTLWNPNRSPDKYPVAFHSALSFAQHPAVLATVATLQEARVEQKRWRAFCASVRNYPLHRLNAVLSAYDTRTRVEQLLGGDWQVLVDIRPKTGKILSKALDMLG